MRVLNPEQRLRSIWKDMHRRCSIKTGTGFKNYGGRGIFVCARWASFENFKMDMGFRAHGMMIERVDNDGPYSPENCIWASRKVQNRNRRNVPLYTLNGESLSLPAWSERFGLKPGCVNRRMNVQGMTLEEALTKPKRYAVWRRNSQDGSSRTV